MDVNTRDVSRKRFLVLVSFFELFNVLYLVAFKIPKPAVWVLLISNILILLCVCVLAFSGALKKTGMNRYFTLLCRYNALIYSIAGGFCLQLSPLQTICAILLVIVIGIICNFAFAKFDEMHQIDYNGALLLVIVVALVFVIVIKMFDIQKVFMEKFALLFLGFCFSLLKTKEQPSHKNNT